MEAQRPDYTQADLSFSRVLLTPQVLLALLICCFFGFRLINATNKQVPEITAIDLATIPQTETQSEEFELVIYDERLLERPVVKLLDVGETRAERAQSLLESLKEELSIWPEALLVSAVYTIPLNGVETTLIDFSVESSAKVLSINEEWRLLESISASLKRNDIGLWRILVNHRESSSFLRFIDLRSFE